MTLLLGAIAGIFYQLQDRIGLDETTDENFGIDSDVPAHVSESLGGEQFFLKIRCWQPGKQIRIERNLSLPVYVMMLALSLTAGGLLGAWLFDEMGAMVLSLIGLVVMLALFEYKMYYRVVRLEWSTRRLYWSFGPFWRSVDFDQISKFQVLDVRSRDSKEHRSALGLVVKRRSGPIILLDTLERDENRSAARCKLEPLSSELKKALRSKP